MNLLCHAKHITHLAGCMMCFTRRGGATTTLEPTFTFKRATQCEKQGVRSPLNRAALHGAVQARLRPPTGPSSLRGCGEGRASRLFKGE